MQALTATDLLYGDVFGEPQRFLTGVDLSIRARQCGADDHDVRALGENGVASWTQEQGDGVLTVVVWVSLSE